MSRLRNLIKFKSIKSRLMSMIALLVALACLSLTAVSYLLARDAMIKQIMDTPDGVIYQATGPMPHSFDPTATKGFGKHRIKMIFADGAKAIPSYGSGAFAGEKEVTTLPRARFMVLSKKWVPDIEHGKPKEKRLEIEVLMLPHADD